MKNAEARFFNQHRRIYDIAGEVVGYEIPPADDPRKKRVALCGADAGFLVKHTDQNRARRREVSRSLSLSGGMIRGGNRPYVKPRKVQ